MKTKQTEQLNKKSSSTPIQSIETGIPNTDVLGMEKQNVENPANKIHGKTQAPKTESKSVKGSPRKGGL